MTRGRSLLRESFLAAARLANVLRTQCLLLNVSIKSHPSKTLFSTDTCLIMNGKLKWPF